MGIPHDRKEKKGLEWFRIHVNLIRYMLPINTEVSYQSHLLYHHLHLHLFPSFLNIFCLPVSVQVCLYNVHSQPVWDLNASLSIMQLMLSSGIYTSWQQHFLSLYMAVGRHSYERNAKVKRSRESHFISECIHCSNSSFFLFLHECFYNFLYAWMDMRSYKSGQ